MKKTKAHEKSTKQSSNKSQASKRAKKSKEGEQGTTAKKFRHVIDYDHQAKEQKEEEVVTIKSISDLRGMYKLVM